MLRLNKKNNVQVDVFYVCLSLLISALILHPYFQTGVYHSTNLDQQFHMPPLLHASRLAWLGEGSFLFNYLTGEPMWGAPHFSPYYPFYGPLAIFFYDGLGIEDYVLIGDYIALIHRLILTISCYYLARTLSIKAFIAVCFAVFVATAEAVRIPSNWYIAICAYAWVPFMIGGTLDIFHRRFVRGLSVLTVSTLLSVYAAPLYLGLGLALIPCILLLFAFIVVYVFGDGINTKNIFQTKKLKVLSLLALSALGLLLMLTPILLSAYFGIEDYVRWLRSGPVTGKNISQVGTELFFETQDWSYAKRLIGEYGTRGIYSSFYLGAIIGFFFLSAPLNWTFSRSKHSQNQYILKMTLWLIALLHFSFIFGEKLIIPSALKYVPLVNSFRHLSAFGAIFIIIATLCAFDSMRVFLKSCLRYDLKSNVKNKNLELPTLIYYVSLFLILCCIFYFSTERMSLLLVFVVFTAVVGTNYFGSLSTFWKKTAIPVLVVLFTLVSITEQQRTKYNEPVFSKRYAQAIGQIDELLEGISVKGELFNAEISPEFGKKEKIGGLFIQSHATTKNFRVLLSYLSPTHFEKFKAGRRTSAGTLESMKIAGVTLLLIDKNFAQADKKYSNINENASLIESTKDYHLYRLQKNAYDRENALCINRNICGSIDGDTLYLANFPFKEFMFRDKANVNSIINSDPTNTSFMLTSMKYNKNMDISISYKARNKEIILIMAILGIILSLSTIWAIRRVN